MFFDISIKLINFNMNITVICFNLIIIFILDLKLQTFFNSINNNLSGTL